MFLRGYDDIEDMDMGYYRKDNIALLEAECERLREALSKESQRAIELINDYNRAQIWRIVLAILLIISCIAGFICLNDYKDAQSAYDFYEQNAVIVGDDDKTYHSYGCSELETDDGFLIFNTNYAEWADYEPCDVCQG